MIPAYIYVYVDLIYLFYSREKAMGEKSGLLPKGSIMNI